MENRFCFDDDKDFIENGIMKMDKNDLLALVVTNAYYLTDSYYKEFGDAIEKRYHQLTEQEEENGSEEKVSEETS